jgi:hypothetical protein
VLKQWQSQAEAAAHDDDSDNGPCIGESGTRSPDRMQIRQPARHWVRAMSSAWPVTGHGGGSLLAEQVEAPEGSSQGTSGTLSSRLGFQRSLPETSGMLRLSTEYLNCTFKLGLPPVGVYPDHQYETTFGLAPR